MCWKGNLKLPRLPNELQRPFARTSARSETAGEGFEGGGVRQPSGHALVVGDAGVDAARLELVVVGERGVELRSFPSKGHRLQF